MSLENAHEPGAVAAVHHVEVELDERGHGRLREWIARGDVHLVDLRRQTVDDHRQQRLVAEHDGRAASVGVALLFAEPGGDVARLDVLGGCGDVADALRPLEVPVDVVGLHVERVGEVRQVLTDVLPGLIVAHVAVPRLVIAHIVVPGLVIVHVVVVEVPVEGGLALGLEGVEEPLLHLLQQVEADEEVAVSGERRRSFRRRRLAGGRC